MTAESALDRAIIKYIRKGYRVESRTETTAQLVKPKKFSLASFFLLGPLSLPMFLSKKDPVVYLVVENGRVYDAAKPRPANPFRWWRERTKREVE